MGVERMTKNKKDPDREDKWSFEVPPPPIPAEDIKETFTADIVIVGAGTSGKAAALSAAEAGASVIQIDKYKTFRWAGGHIAAIGSRLQKKLGIEVDKDDVCLQLMKYGNNKPDQRLLRLWADNSGAVMDWLMDMAEPEFIETVIYQAPFPDWYDWKTENYPEFPVCHYQKVPGTEGNIMNLDHSMLLNVLQDRAVKLGVDIRYQTRGVQLIRKGNGRVTGIIARDREDNHVQFNARKAVILCTGDYASNLDMMRKYCPIALDVARGRNVYMKNPFFTMEAPEPLNVGDGHLMAMWIGAVMEEGPHAPVAHPFPRLDLPPHSNPFGTSVHLRVNIEGARYENEDVPGQSIANSLRRQPGKKVWLVCDSRWPEQLPRFGPGLGRVNKVDNMLRARVEEIALKADTIEELGRKMGVPVETFKATVARYNELAVQGKDLDFGKRPDRLFPIDEPPFYAGVIEQSILVVLGGLNVNPRLQPLDTDWKVIPGLYLAGNTVGNRFAVDYPTMCPGLTHGMAYVTGRLAALNAAAEKV
jgi:succinate dehydrogenase/fumarate reductase flavoprotein subunit